MGEDVVFERNGIEYYKWDGKRKPFTVTGGALCRFSAVLLFSGLLLVGFPLLYVFMILNLKRIVFSQFIFVLRVCLLLTFFLFLFSFCDSLSQLNMHLPISYNESDTKDENFLRLVYDTVFNVRMSKGRTLVVTYT